MEEERVHRMIDRRKRSKETIKRRRMKSTLKDGIHPTGITNIGKTNGLCVGGHVF